MGSSNHAEWQLERDRMVVAAGVLGALCPGSFARVGAGFVFVFCGGVFIRLPEGSGHHLYSREHPGAFWELGTWVMCRSRWKVLVQHWSSGSIPSVPGVTTVPEHCHQRPLASQCLQGTRRSTTNVRAHCSHLTLLSTASPPFQRLPAPRAARAPKPQETSNKRLFELDVKA